MAIIVNSTTFSNAFYPAITRNYLFGNVGDEITVVINFTTVTTPITATKFSFGLIENSVNEYPDAPTYEIPLTLFQNPQTQTPQTFSGSVGTLNNNNPIFWNTGSAVFADLGSNIYEITHTFVLSPLFQESQLDVQPPATPDYFLGGKCLRYIYEIDLFDALINPVPQETTRGTDLTTQFSLGNTGYFNEFYNTGTNQYSLVSQSYSVDPNTTESSTVTGQIQFSGGAFDVADDLVLIVGFLPSELAQDATYTSNYQLERISIKADGVPVSGTLASNFFCEINADTSLLDYFFQIPALSNTNIFWYVQVSTDSTAEQNENIWGNYLAVETGVSDSSILLLRPDGATGVQDFRFYKWHTFDITEGHNHLKAYRNDDIHALWRLDVSGATVNSVTFGVKNRVTGQIINGESYSFTPAELPLIIARNFVRATSNINAEIRVQELTTGIYSFFYGFQIWTDFVQDNLVLFCRIDAGDDTIEFQSPDFEIGQYAITQNGAGEPQVLPAPTDPIIYNLADTTGAIVDPTNIGAIISGQNTYIKATFTDENLNDLQRLQSELRGYFNLLPENGGQESVRAFFDEYDSETTTPFQEVVGHTAGRVKVTKVDTKTVTLEAVLIWSRLVSNFTTDQLQALCVIPRIDSIDSFVFTTKYIGFHFRDDLYELSFQLTEALTDVQVLAIFGGVPLGSITYYYNTADIWPPSTQYTLADWKSAVSTASVGDWIRLTTSATGFIDSHILLQYVTATAAPASFTVTVDLVRGLDNDFAIPLPAGDGIQLTSVTGTNLTDVQGKAVAGEPSTADWVNFSQANLLSSVATINTELSAVSSVDHTLIIKADYINNQQSGQVVVNGTFDGGLSDYTGITDAFYDWQYRDALNINSKVYDGVNDYDIINGWNQTTFNNTTPFSILFIYYNNNFTSDISGGQRLFSCNPFPSDLGNIEYTYGQGAQSFGDFRITSTAGGTLRVLGINKLGFNTGIVTYDGSGTTAGLNMYLNGSYNEYIPKINTFSGTSVNAQNDFIIGKFSTSTNAGFLGRRTNGYQVKLEIINRVLTPAEVRQTYIDGFITENTSNFLLRVDFNQTGTAALVDTGSVGYTINNVGGAAYTPFYGL